MPRLRAVDAVVRRRAPPCVCVRVVGASAAPALSVPAYVRGRPLRDLTCVDAPVKVNERRRARHRAAVAREATTAARAMVSPLPCLADFRGARCLSPPNSVVCWLHRHAQIGNAFVAVRLLGAVSFFFAVALSCDRTKVDDRSTNV